MYRKSAFSFSFYCASMFLLFITSAVSSCGLQNSAGPWMWVHTPLVTYVVGSVAFECFQLVFWIQFPWCDDAVLCSEPLVVCLHLRHLHLHSAFLLMTFSTLLHGTLRHKALGATVRPSYLSKGVLLWFSALKVRYRSRVHIRGL